MTRTTRMIDREIIVGDDEVKDVIRVRSCRRLHKLFELQSLDHVMESRIDGGDVESWLVEITTYEQRIGR